MKKFTKKLKGKKVLSLVLAAIMLATTFNMALPMLKLDASAAEPVEIGTTGDITQERVVGVSTDAATPPTYPEIYENHAATFLNGAGKPTNIVIPGLNATNKSGDTTTVDYNDWVVQGLSYYEKKDWIMVSVYHNDGNLPSMIFALDAKSGDFVYAFAIKEYNANGELVDNMDHGGGLAFSEYNFYYSGDDSDLDDNDGDGDADQIAYAPLDYFDNPSNYDNDMFPDVIIKDAVDLPEMGGAATAYVCYDEGILWAGNFYEDGTGGADYAVPVIPANDTNGIALQNSMIYGYKLQGGDSETEWKYLTGAMGNTSDRAGKPTHCIAVDTDYEDIQYAVVDNGKVYLSRSWGTGTNDEWFATKVVGDWIASLDPYSILTVGDIDLSAEGTEKIQYKTTDESTVTTYAHKLDNSNTQHFDMMPMSEGLCFIGDDLYISFEGASNKYMNEYEWALSGGSLTKTGNCDYPIDVVWHVDPYLLMGEERQETKDAIKFEKVTELEDIDPNEEYIILYESPEKNLVNQENILYAFDAYGNFKDLKLSKSTDTDINGYDGMIGHSISEYSVELVDGKETLYLANPEKDDLLSLRWNILDANAGARALRIQSPLAYYSSNRNFYFNADTISMTNDTGIANDPLTLEKAGDTGNFYLKNDNSYIWCNDFSVSGYEAAANKWYGANSSTEMYSGLKEEKGTFHTDALNKSGNIIGQSIDTTKNDYLRQVSIYKCVVDEFSSTEKNRVYTDMSAELQSDGTYTVNLETYATSALHYKASDVKKPTDFIFVLDTSTSMAKSDGTGFIPYNGDLDCYSVAGEVSSDICDGSNPATAMGNIYIKVNGEYVNVKVETSKKSETEDSNFLNRKYRQYVWLYGTYQGNVWYWVPEVPGVQAENAKGSWQLKRPSESETMVVEGGSQDNRADTPVFWGPHYRYTTNDYYNANNEGGRYVTMRETACNIIDEVVADATATGLDHKFAVTCYGTTNGFYDSNTKELSTGIDYSKAFWSKDQAGSLKDDIINSITVSLPTSDPGNTVTSTDDTDNTDAILCGDVFKHANGIIDINKETYAKTDENGRNVAVIFISDGVAGNDTIKNDKRFSFSDDNFVLTHGGDSNDANSVISQAKALKENGAFIYTVLIGQSSSADYKKEDYMKAVSSQYPEAADLATLGGECAELTSYYIDLSKSTSLHFLNYVDKLVRDVKTNDSVGVEKLAASTVIIEQLSDAFIIPLDENEHPDYDYTLELYRGYYDCLDRFQFEKTDINPKTLGIEAGYTKNDFGEDAIKITGFNYSDYYIARGREDDGYKLKVTINGLLANPEANITNTSINNTNTTAIYQSYDDANLSANTPTKYFPTEYFTIPEYTYVLDYGFDMYDSDVNGTMLALDNGPNKQIDKDGDKKIDYSTEITSKMVEMTNGNQDLIYRHNPAYAQDSGFVLIKRDSGEYDWFEIKVVPASNVLCEESAITIDDKISADAPSEEPTYKWERIGTTPEIDYQDLSTENDVYGYDSNYTNSTGFSNGTHYYTTVDASTKFSDAATVTFKGNGFDLLSACGPNTGVQTVSLKRVNEDGTKEFVQGFIVDTYLNKGSELLDSEDGLVYQVPIVKWQGAYDTYIVESEAYYLKGGGAVKNHGKTNSIKNSLIDTGLVMNTAEFDSGAEIEKIIEAEGWDKDKVELIWFDDNSVLNGGTGVAAQKNGSRAKVDKDNNIYLENYIDGFRIYNPLQDTSSYIESERDAQYVNVLNNLANGTLSDGSLDFESGNIAFITGSLTSTDDNGNEVKETLSFANYNKFGPSDELYLKGGATDEGVIFKTPVASGGRVMVSLRSANGVATTAKIYDKEFTINSATEMYYDITDLLPVGADGKATVSIINTGNGILAVNNIKLTNTVASTGLMMLSMDDLETAQYYANMEPVQATVENGVVTPVEEEEEIPEDNTNTGNDNTNDGADTEESDKEEFSIFSIIEMLIAFIEKILYNAFGAGIIA